MKSQENKIEAGRYEIHFPESGNTYLIKHWHGGTVWDADWIENRGDESARFLIREKTKKACKKLLIEWEKAISPDYQVSEKEVSSKFNTAYYYPTITPSPFKTEEHEKKVKEVLQEPHLISEIESYYTADSELEKELENALKMDYDDWGCYPEEVTQVDISYGPIPDSWFFKAKGWEGEPQYTYYGPIASLGIAVVCEDEEGQKVKGAFPFVGD